MSDPRILKMAELIVHYSLELQPRQKLAIFSNPLADELLQALYAEALRAGAYAYLLIELPNAWEIFYKNAAAHQLEFVSPITELIFKTFDARVSIDAEQNPRMLSNIDSGKMAQRARAQREINQVFFDRSASGDLRWCSTLYPTHAAAQEADMSLSDYREFVFAACKLNEPDPVALWQEEGRRQRELGAWLQGKDQVILKGADIDLRLSIQGRRFELSDGKYNLPDGEIFTGPVEDSANGWVRFRYPAVERGREVADVELWFENGKVVKEQASKGLEFLSQTLNADAGARYLGEWGIGTNYSIPRFSKNMLFDEKLGGTIHLALGASYPETGGRNQSGIHWDMLVDMADGEIWADGELFYQNGKPVLWE